jgi:hypothetical protein
MPNLSLATISCTLAERRPHESQRCVGRHLILEGIFLANRGTVWKKTYELLLRGLGPNGVGGVRRVGGKVAEGLSVIQPRLPDLLGGVGVIGDSEVIRSGDAFVAFFPEFLPRLSVDDFL